MLVVLPKQSRVCDFLSVILYVRNILLHSCRKLQGSRVCRTVKSSDGRITAMPVCFIEAPLGIRAEAKKRMVEKITSAIGEAYHTGDTLIFLREYPAENVAMDGCLQSENPKILEALKKIRSGG